MTADRDLALVIATVPELRGGSPVGRLGGMTNVNIKVESPQGTFVVRIDAADEDILDIDRADELVNAEAAAAAGVGPPVVAWLPEQGVLVTEFLGGGLLRAEDIGARLAELAALLRRLHHGCRFRGGIDMFVRQRDYQREALARGCELPEGYLRYGGHLERIREAFAANPVGPVACHHDLVAENIIDTPGGLRLIDFEYAGTGDPYSDLGDACSESHLRLDQLEALVGHYHGSAEPALVARTRLWGLVSKYGWTLWAVLRNEFEPNPLLMRWGRDLYATVAAEFESETFERLLGEVGASSARLSA